MHGQKSADAGLDAVFAALADPTRRAILARLSQGEATVAELAAPFAISQPAVSRHLRVLEEAGLIGSRIDGTRRPRHLNPAAVDRLWTWIEQMRAGMEQGFARLDRLLETMDDTPEERTDR